MKTNFLLLLFSFIALFSYANLYTVTDTTANSTSSLAYAISQANAHLGADTIEFNIPGLQLHEISTDSINNIIDTLLIDGLSQPGNVATNYSNTTIRLKGNRGLSIHSAGCSIIGIAMTNTDYITALQIVADSGKSCDNTLVRRFFFSTNISAYGIKISTDSLGLSSKNIIIDSSKFQGRSTGIEIYINALADLNDIQIRNNELHCYNSLCNVTYDLEAIVINRKCPSPLNPEIEIRNNYLGGHIYLFGYLDSLYVGHNEIHSNRFEISNTSINNTIIEYNQIAYGHGNIYPFYIHNFLNDTVRNIRIQNNSIDGLDFTFSFNGNNQYFDSIIFSGNELSTTNISFEKTTASNVDSQHVSNLIVKNNFCGNGIWYVLMLFNFSGKSIFSNLQIENNTLNSATTYLELKTDSLTRIKSCHISDNTINYNQDQWLMHIRNNGFIDTLSILNNSLTAYNNLFYEVGINLESRGRISNLKISQNNFSIHAANSPWGITTCGILLNDKINVNGEISHNTFENCSGAGINSFNYTIDSATVLLIDSNIFYGSYHNAISINTRPYNPPSQRIGCYTILGNNIYSIGKEGIYRFSQHDTSSCMTCIPKPVLLYGEYFNGITTVNGSLTGDTLTNYIIEYFSNNSPDTGGYTEGHTFIHRDTITTDAIGNAVFSTSIQGNFLDSFITSTATSMVTYQTSEFSNETGVVLGTTNSDVDTEITVFPNPVSRDLFIYTSTQSISQIDLIDLLGKRTSVEFSDPHSNKINLKNLLPGFYFLEIHFGDKTIIKKILKN